MRLRRPVLIAAVGAVGLLSPLALASGPASPVTDAVSSAAGACDGLDTTDCLLPFPSDFYTVADASSATGRRVHLSPLAMPANVLGKHIDPTEWNRQDGFSPGTPILVHVPGLDPAASHIPDANHVADSLAADSPVVLVDTRTGERYPYWAELDTKAAHPVSLDAVGTLNTLSELGDGPDFSALPVPAVKHPAAGDDMAKQALIIHPAKNFAEGSHVAVGLRNLVNSAGKAIPAGPAFSAIRSGSDTSRPTVTAAIATLGAQGVDPASLYLAWDFTIASADSIAGRLLHIRDDAFAKLGTAAPKFTVDTVTANPDTGIAKRVQGKVTVPLYLTTDKPAHANFFYGGKDLTDPDAVPVQNPVTPTMDATYTCNIPATATADNPAGVTLYGHGLLGGQGEVNSGPQHDMAKDHNLVYCAVDWIGMATEDVPNVGSILVDMSNFSTLADRVQQGVLDFLFLGRAAKLKSGLGSNPAFQVAGKSVLSGDVFYDGNSQGGIIGGVVMGVAQDITRGVLGVPGINYSILLDRSTDFATYSTFMYAAYPDRLDQEEVFALIQMLWDRAEGNGYVAHVTDKPYAGTRAHQVIYTPAFGDHQVSTYTVEVAARTNGAQVYRPVTATSRAFESEMFALVPSLGDPGYNGSAVFLWDSGAAKPPLGNQPPSTGFDPHGHPRADRGNQAMKAHFYATGEIVPPCSGGPCFTKGFTAE